ncbi:MAG: hypothetical protein J1E34_03865 [Oscillospiraceae bacterium]|nr:hypothetical protein [Oscillospiraceae bacterium]
MSLRTLQNGLNVETYPLTQAQRFMFFVYNSFGKNSPVLNIGTGYYWKDDFRPDLLKEALTEAMERCEPIRMRLCFESINGVNQLVQYFVPDAEIPVEEFDFRDIPYEESYEIIKGWTKELIDMIDKPLHLVRIIRLPNGMNGMYLKFHHLAFDGYAAKAFIADVMGIYLSKKCGKPYPKPLRSYFEAMQEEFAYLDSDERKKDRQFWLETFTKESEPIFNDYLLDNRLKKAREESGDPNRRYISMYEGDHPESRTLMYELSKEESDSIMTLCRENDLSVPCVLMLGLRTALSAFNQNQPDVSFKFMINRRGTLLHKKSGGNRWHFYTLRTNIAPELSFRKAIDAVNDAQSAVLRHCNFDTLEMYHLKHMAMKMSDIGQTYDSMTFSYQAPLEVPYESEEIKATTQGIWYNNDFSAQNLYLTVKHRANDNGLEFIFEYRISENSREDLEILYPKMLKAIMLGVHNPDITIGEILEEIKL